MRKHRVAALTVSYGRIWHTREVGDLILGYNAAGRLARVVFLDPLALLPRDPTVRHAVEASLSALSAEESVSNADIEVLQSALSRAPIGTARAQPTDRYRAL
ncbi:MAG TPA: hypothetical protein VM840_12205 [Actinomycetota bacterium]|nr:hypothetical protein [Actinomycetota bacterium]